MTLQVTAAPWSAKGIIAALRETNHIVLDRFSVKECNNKTCICCTTACAAWLNEFYGWIKHGPSVDQFFRLLHSPLFLNGPGYPTPWGCPRWISILLGWRMYKAHPKTYRAAFLKCLALWAPKDCHLLFLFKRLSSLEEHCGTQTSISLTLRVFNLVSLSCGYAPFSSCPVSLTRFVSFLITEPLSSLSIAGALYPPCTPAPQLVWAHPLVLGQHDPRWCETIIS